MNPNSVITRFPPSPTGYLHIGSVRTALFNYLFSRHAGGKMYLRFEDTDRERSKKEYEDDILAGLAWLGISYTLPEVPRQSQRTQVYQKYFEVLLAKGLAYEAEAAKDDPDKKVVRFKNPNTAITFTDLVRGDVSFDTTELGDFVIAKSTTEPLYHLAVVIDDYEMGVTHVIRGEDHISNTPRQILILEALGFPRPQYAHIPLILAPDRTKLSKRHGAVSVNEYRAQGYIPEALLNYLAFLGWNPGGDRELFSLDELTELFTLGHVQKGGAIFNLEKLRWFNHEHLRKLSPQEFYRRLEQFLRAQQTEAPAYLSRIAPLLQERAHTLLEAADALKNEEFSFMENMEPPAAELLLKGAKAGAAEVQKTLAGLQPLLEGINSEVFTAERVREAVFPYAEERGRSAVLWPLRVALSGKERSPDPFTLAQLLGKEETLKRIAAARQVL